MQALKGTHDILPSEVYKWDYMESVIRDVCARYGYKEIRTPIIEATELFQRGIGDSTDVVSKEMYTFLDRGNRSVTLRPENTASAVRAFLNINCMLTSRFIRCFILDQCSDMTGRRQGDTENSINSGWKYWEHLLRWLMLKLLPWLVKYSISLD